MRAEDVMYDKQNMFPAKLFPLHDGFQHTFLKRSYALTSCAAAGALDDVGYVVDNFECCDTIPELHP